MPISSSKNIFPDAVFKLINSSDNTKIAVFDCGNIAPSTQRNYQFPDDNGEIALVSSQWQVLFATQLPTDASAVDITGIPGGFFEFQLEILASSTSVAQDQIRMTLNADTTVGHYLWTQQAWTSAGDAYTSGSATAYMPLGYIDRSLTAHNSYTSVILVNAPSLNTEVVSQCNSSNNATGQPECYNVVARWTGTSAITEIYLYPANAGFNFQAGSYFILRAR